MALIKQKFGTLQLYWTLDSTLSQMADHGSSHLLDSEFIIQMEQRLMMKERNLMVGVRDLTSGLHFGVQKLPNYTVIQNQKVERIQGFMMIPLSMTLAIHKLEKVKVLFLLYLDLGRASLIFSLNA